MASRPSVLFVCIHNAGRSQMAAGFLRDMVGGGVEVRSAGSDPGPRINPAAVEAMSEVGIDISDQSPKLLTHEAVETSDVVITMGCGDACPVFPGISYRDWALEDPAGKGIDAVRPIRDEIRTRVQALVAELLPARTHLGRKPSVLFVCVKNGGKSQMAAALMRKLAGDRIEVYSAGTAPGSAINTLSAQSLLEVGADITGEHPKPIDPALLRQVDLVVTLGREARVDVPPGTRLENWDTDEPSERGIEGIERMRLVRDDIAAHVQRLEHELNSSVPQTDEEI
jgi:protein-tyrosine-phosphatase